MKLKKAVKGLRALYSMNIGRDPGGLVPPTLVVLLSDRCNYRCVTCNAYDIGDKDKELSTEQWRKVLDDFKRLDGVSVRFTGGEVFLRRKTLYGLVEHLEGSGVTAKISTNGSLIRDRDIEFLKNHPVGGMEISFHGREKNHEDYVKIKGSHARTVETIDKLLANGIPVRIAFTIINTNIDDIEYMAGFARQRGTSVSFNILDTNLYYFQNMDRSVVPDARQMNRASEILIDLKKRYPDAVNGTEAHFRAIPRLCENSRMPEYHCARALMNIYIDSFGNVYHGCWAMPASGNVRQNGLGAIIGSDEYREARRKGFNKDCPGCTCGYQMDISMSLWKRRRQA